MSVSRSARSVVVSALVLVAAPWSTAAGQGTQAQSFPNTLKTQVDQVFAAFTKPGSPGCALAVYQNGEIVYSRGYGLASIEHNVPITPRTIFDIGSTAKQFTAFSVLLLERDGKLSLDDDVRKHIPELPAYERPITVRHLMLHTSGLRDYLTLWALAGVRTEAWTTQRDAVRLVARQRRANFAAGDEWLYSNSGYLLLAEIVQRASGKSLKDFAAERIFRPLGMTQTFYQDDHTLVVPRKAIGYEPREAGGFAVDMSNFEQIGDGAVQTTVEDLLQWDRNFYTPKVGDRALIDAAQRVGKLAGGKVLDYAAGLRIGRYRGQATVRHGGAWAGYRAELLRFPVQTTSIACLCNLGTAGPSELANRVADIVLGPVLKPVAQPPTPAGAGAEPVSVPEATLSGYAGVYRRADRQEYRRFTVKDGKLVADGGTPLTPVAADRFLIGKSGGTVVFLPAQGGNGGQCQILAAPGADAPPVAYRRLPPVGSVDLGSFAGDYYSDELDATWVVRVVDGGLAAGVGDPDQALVAVEPDTFLTQSGVVLVFTRAGGGGGARVHAGRVRDLEFRRK